MRREARYPDKGMDGICAGLADGHEHMFAVSRECDVEITRRAVLVDQQIVHGARLGVVDQSAHDPSARIDTFAHTQHRIAIPGPQTHAPRKTQIKDQKLRMGDGNFRSRRRWRWTLANVGWREVD